MLALTDLPPRACGLCIYARHANPSHHSTCWHPRVTIARGPVPLTEARASGGGCGPEAIHLHIPGVIDGNSETATRSERR
jgi:hypothetical protein